MRSKLLSKKARIDLISIEEKKNLVAQKRKDLVEGLPHLYHQKFKWYKWAWDFFKSTNRMNLLFAANQISKSSSQIRKAVEWCGNPRIWPKLWNSTPSQMWYLYPSQQIINAEWHSKWKDFMPRETFKDHPTYGWKPIKDGSDIKGVIFNSGCILYFKTYTQNVQNLQSSSVYSIFCDEELPEELYSELMFRLEGVDGYFHIVATPTLNQLMWRHAAEGSGDQELFPSAFKQTVSMYDCRRYMDGTEGAYNDQKIANVIARCKSETEVQRRVHGKFVTELGRKYAQYEAMRHLISPKPVPLDWRRYSAVDLGSGGETGHPPAICFVAVSPDFREGLVYRCWRGDDGPTYTMGDVFVKYLELRGKDEIVEQRYDQQARDFRTIAERAGETFICSNKLHEAGEAAINTLFKNDMLHIIDSFEARKLSDELTTLMLAQDKKKAKDDLCDALRYCITSINWDWSYIRGEPSDDMLEKERTKPFTEEEIIAYEIDQRRGAFTKKTTDSWEETDLEFEEWNDMYGS